MMRLMLPVFLKIFQCLLEFVCCMRFLGIKTDTSLLQVMYGAL